MGTSEKDLDRQCIFIKEADVCFRNFTSNCASPMQKQLFDMMFDSSSRLQTDYCTSGSTLRKLYLKHAPCLNTVIKDQKPCIKDLQVAFEAVTTAKWDKRLPLGCCAYRRVRKCLTDLMEKKCGEDTVDFVNDMLQAALSRLPDLMCDEFTLGSKACKELPAVGSAPKGGKSTSILNRLLSAYTNI